MTALATHGVLGEVWAERRSQVARWGDQYHHPLFWLSILTEEVGEVAKECAEGRIKPFNHENYRAELVQVAAVAVAAVEALDSGRMDSI